MEAKRAAALFTMMSLVTATLAAKPAHSATANAAGLDIGFGAMRTAPFSVGSPACATLGVEYRRALPRGPLALRVEARGTHGEGPGSEIPEDAYGGRQTLLTLLAGVELVGRGTGRGAFLDVGLGTGYSAIWDAHGRTQPPDWGMVILRSHAATAYGLGAGYRFGRAGAGPRAQTAVRVLGIANGLADSWATATIVTLGAGF